jgi:hypothetical protein
VARKVQGEQTTTGIKVMQIYVGFPLPLVHYASLRRTTEWVGFLITHKPKIRLICLHGYALRDTQIDHASLPDAWLHSEWPGFLIRHWVNLKVTRMHQTLGYTQSDHASLPDTELYSISKLHDQTHFYIQRDQPLSLDTELHAFTRLHIRH